MDNPAHEVSGLIFFCSEVVGSTEGLDTQCSSLGRSSVTPRGS